MAKKQRNGDKSMANPMFWAGFFIPAEPKEQDSGGPSIKGGPV
jgi:hypothetical protein